MAPLAFQAFSRLWSGFRPSTLAAYQRMFHLFLSVLVALEPSLPQLSTLYILTFMEYLLQACMTASNITNHKRIPLFIKAVKFNRLLQAKLHFIIDENILYDRVNISFQLQYPETFIALYLIAFFSFLRL